MKTEGQRLYEKARRLIPGGTQLLSKRPEMFLPDQWPNYYTRARGAEVWGLDGRKYVDMSISGIGACTLGYADPDVDAAVKRAIDDGTMTTLNCPEEVGYETAVAVLKVNEAVEAGKKLVFKPDEFKVLTNSC